ncbi:hypothetical protein BDFG_09388, partial [Blastomyces dermatitidis ATCC 26199]
EVPDRQKGERGVSGTPGVAQPWVNAEGYGCCDGRKRSEADGLGRRDVWYDRTQYLSVVLGGFGFGVSFVSDSDNGG